MEWIGCFVEWLVGAEKFNEWSRAARRREKELDELRMTVETVGENREWSANGEIRFELEARGQNENRNRGDRQNQ